MIEGFFNKFFAFSIRTKILFLGIGLIIASFATYLPYVLNTFLQDKKAYIFDATLNQSHEIQTNITRLLDHKEKDVLVYASQDPAFFQTEEFKRTANKENLLQYERYSYNGQFKQTATVIHEPVLRNHSLEKSNLEEITKTPWEIFTSMIARKRYIEYVHFGSVPALRVFLYDELNQSLHYAVFVGDEVSDFFSAGTSFSNILMNVGGGIMESSSKIQIPVSILEKLVLAGLPEGVITQKIDEKDYLISFSKVTNNDWLVLSVIDEAEAYKVSDYLLRKTLSFAGIIISLGIFFGTLLAKSLTKPIDDLLEGTDQIAKRNFYHVIPTRTNDEHGRLAESFNFMNKEILGYIEEVKEKSRMENELAVAQLVQNSFFPESKIHHENFSVLGHYSPASECGGDWWGTRTIGDKTLLFIADATGHGMPAALITATTNCVANMLPQICTSHPEMLESPAKILECFNTAVYKVGGKILMTFFIAIYDKNTKTIKYANASHNPPYLYRFNEQEPQKSDFSLLLDAQGERLGHVENPTYTEGSVHLNDHDVLIMVTDGIIDAKNAQDKAYGEGRFLKSLAKNVKNKPEDLLSGILQDSDDFLSGIRPEDDVTLIIAKRELT